MKNKKNKISCKIAAIVIFVLMYTQTTVVLSATSDECRVHDCVISLLRSQILTGYNDGSIRSESKITREEAAAVIIKAVAYKNARIKPLPENYKTIYSDNVSKWALEYVNLATLNGIYSGYTDNTFKGTKNITREEASKIIAIAFNKALPEDFELIFCDKNDISEWSLPYIEALVKNNLIDGYYDNSFKPQDEITRAEFFMIICKELKLHGQESISKEISSYLDDVLCESQKELENVNTQHNAVLEQFNIVLEEYIALGGIKFFSEPNFIAVNNDNLSNGLITNLDSILNNYLENVPDIFEKTSMQEIKQSILAENDVRIDEIVNICKNIRNINCNIDILNSYIEEMQKYTAGFK